MDIIEGKKAAYKIYEDAQTIAILDINPVTKGHMLVIPKQPIDHLDDCPPDVYQAVFRTTQQMSKLIKKVFQPERVSVVVHGYEIPHAHVHVVPLYTGKELHFADRKKAARTSDELAIDMQKLLETEH